MLIPEKGKWRWDDGPLCETQEEALMTAKIKTKDSVPKTYIVDGCTEIMKEATDEK